jgi:hypothetical protein
MANETTSELTPEQMAARIAELEARIAKGGTLRFKAQKRVPFRSTGWLSFRLLSTWSNGKGSYRIPTNCASSSKPTERNSRSRTKSRILKGIWRRTASIALASSCTLHSDPLRCSLHID